MKPHGVKVVLFVALGMALSLPSMFAAPGGQASHTATPVKAKAATTAPAAATAGQPVDLSLRKAYGSRQAPVTIEVFSDYQCPQCRLFYLTTATQLMQNYVDTGKVYLVHRDFPLSMHSHSNDAARWANAAAVAGGGLFELVDHALYQTQDTWAASGKIDDALATVLTPSDMKRLRAAETSEGPEIDAAINKDKNLGTTKHVDGTPTIFVVHSGQSTELPAGSVDYALLKKYLDYLLAQK